MRVVIQRVKRASVSVDGIVVGAIGKGILVFLGVGEKDTEQDIEYMVNKISHLRIFPDAGGKMNLSVLDEKLDVLIISQFTLYGCVKKGFRPSFTEAAPPAKGEKYYEKFCVSMEAMGLKTEKGIFGAMMDIELINDGPVTILIDSEKNF
jgi:D-tyrosyl-tRNA(Tyr) deacylase